MFYVFPTGTKDKIYYGHQKQFNAYKHALATAYASHPAGPDGGSARSGADGRTVSDAHARDRRTQPHRSSAVRWIWSDGRERPGRLVKDSHRMNEGSGLIGCCPRWIQNQKEEGSNVKRTPHRFRSHRSHIGNSFSSPGILRERSLRGRYKRQGDWRAFALIARFPQLAFAGVAGFNFGAVTESSAGEPESASELNRRANQPGEQPLVHLESVQQL